MCFGPVWSGVSFSTLMVAAVLCAWMNVPWRILVTVVFLAIKEWLQLMLYGQLEKEGASTNRALTVLSWIHISFQPLVVNLFISAFSKKPQLYDVPLMLCLIFAVANMVRLKDLGVVSEAAMCSEERAMNVCRPQTLSEPGKLHLAYGMALISADVYSFVPTMFTYYLLMFGPAYIIGDWQIASIHAVVAGASALAAPGNAGEAGAMWCLNSFWIGILAVWYGWRGGSPF